MFPTSGRSCGSAALAPGGCAANCQDTRAADSEARIGPTSSQRHVRGTRFGAAGVTGLSAKPIHTHTGAGAGQVTTAVAPAETKDAVIWAEPIGPMPTFPPPMQPAEMAQVNLAFTPRVLPVVIGTTVDFPNRDKVYHSIFSFSRQQRFEIGLVKLFCNIHDQMFGSILVLPTPYFSLATADGAFTIPDIPAGDYTVQVWHERLQGTPQTVSMTAGGTAELSFALQPKRRDRRSVR